MSAQLEIDFAAPIARTTDPSQCHEAAANVNLGRLQSLVLAAAKEHERLKGDWTATEIGFMAASLFGLLVESYRKRVGELARAGRIVPTVKRLCRETGVKAQAWKLAQ